jgi:hypothetical protein
MRKIGFLLLLLFLQVGFLTAQSFNYRWKLDTISKSGFHRLLITPEISRFLRADFNDLRIVDDSNRNVPHIIKGVGVNWVEQLFKEFPIVSNSVTDSSQSVLTISNPTGQAITQLKIFLRNSSVSRPASLSGSNDNKTWFIIDDQLQLNRSFETIKDQYIQELDFPLANYRYFKLVVDNLNNDPINITKIGSYQNIEYRSINPYLQNPAPSFRQKDSANESFVEISWPIAQHIDKLSLKIGAPKFYNRNVKIYLPNYKGSLSTGLGDLIGSFTLRSGTSNSVDFPRIKTNRLFCIVENADNPPLKIDALVAEQLSFEAITYLEKNENYSLLLDNSMAVFPNYDLSAFTDSIGGLSDFIEVTGNPEMIKPISATPDKDSDRWWIWPALALLVLSLGFLTYRLVLDMKKRDS